MRYLGIDYGKRRVGVAISDGDGRLAFPETVLANDKNLVENFKKICAENKVGVIVLGESRDLKAGLIRF